MASRWYNYCMKIERPGLALFITLGTGFLLYQYGIRDGTLLLVAFFVGVFAYKLLSPSRR